MTLNYGAYGRFLIMIIMGNAGITSWTVQTPNAEAAALNSTYAQILDAPLIPHLNPYRSAGTDPCGNSDPKPDKP